jgi:hypothetical protein
MVPTRLAEFNPLNKAEERVIADLRSGALDRLGDGSRPEGDDPARVVRAELLRFLILGGDEDSRPHEKGLRISGAYVSGVLRSAVIDNLFLDGSAFPGLQADRLEARGGLYLRSAVVSGELELRGARLGGHFDCRGATISNGADMAISADGLEARGSVLLRGATVVGGIGLPAARLGGDLDCVGVSIERPGEVALDADNIEMRGDFALRSSTIAGETKAQGARIGGDVDCSGATLQQPGGDALKLNRAAVEGAFFLRKGARVRGALVLTAATVGAIDDERESWPLRGDLLLNRCRYGAFIGGPVDSDSRLDWLARQVPENWGEDFWPQPYEQLSTVFREMGHDEDARAVLIAKERLQRRARRSRARNPFLRASLWATDAVLGATIRYGRQPLVAFVWLAAFWAVGVVVFGVAERHGALKPNSAVILRSTEWTQCSLPQDQQRFIPSTGTYVAGRAQKGQLQLFCFRDQPEAASYPEFNAWVFSLDVLLPVIEIGQKLYWRPDPSQQFGPFALNYYYFQSIVGWVLSLLAVAGFSGLARSN